MPDPPSPAGGKAWRQRLDQERQQIARTLQNANEPKNLDEALAALDSIHRLTKRYVDADGSNLDSPPSADEKRAAQTALDRIHDWFATTMEDSKLARFFTYNHDLTYSSAQWAALNTLDATRFLKQYAVNGKVSGQVWKDKLTAIDRTSRRYIRALLEGSPAEATTADKAANLVVLGFLAIPMVAAAVIAAPEVAAAFSAGSLSAVCAIPGGSTVVAFVVEHYVLAEVIAYFAVGTIVRIGDAGGIRGFVHKLETPEGAFQEGVEIVFFIMQVRAGRGGGGDGYVRVRGRVVSRTPQGVNIQVERVEEIEPTPAAPPKLGQIDLTAIRNQRPGRPLYQRSSGPPPEELVETCAPSIKEARRLYGERENCDAHQEHHVGNLPAGLKRNGSPSPIGGEHCIVEVEFKGKRYTIDSSAKQFVREPGVHNKGIIDMQKVLDLDARRPNLHLKEALDRGVFSTEQYNEFKKLCGYLPD